MSQSGFTHEELRGIFNLDPDRPEDRPSIAALRASSSRLLDEPRGPATHRNLRDTIRQLLGKHRGHAAKQLRESLHVSPLPRIVSVTLDVAVGTRPSDKE
jgi:hypothetical protein